MTQTVQSPADHEPSHVIAQRLDEAIRREREAIVSALKARGYTGQFMVGGVGAWDVELHADFRIEWLHVASPTCEGLLCEIAKLPLTGAVLIGECEQLRTRVAELEGDYQALLSAIARVGLMVEFAGDRLGAEPRLVIGLRGLQPIFVVNNCG